MTEQWKPIDGYGDKYQVSNQGRVALRTGEPVPQVVNAKRGGYAYVTLRHEGRQFSRKVHQLVCAAFVGPRPPGAITRHLDDDPLNNVPSNLMWGTHGDNLQDRIRNRGHHNSLKSECVNGHPLAGENLGINATTGGRFCRECARETKRRYAARRKEAA